MESEFVKEVISKLTKRYGLPKTQLEHQSMADLFVAVLLSPQCTDKQVNVVTKSLFKKYKTFEDYANSDLRTLQKNIHGVNYYKTKAKHLRESARMILGVYNGEVPKTLKELMELPGVGRKVANVVMVEGHELSKGIPVDTHNITVARRLGISRHKDPYKVELDMMKKIPQKDWHKASNLFIELGRDTCKMRNKECYRCVLKDICPSSDAK